MPLEGSSRARKALSDLTTFTYDTYTISFVHYTCGGFRLGAGDLHTLLRFLFQSRR